MYGQQHAVDDAKHMLDHLKIAKAHIVGLSQGAFATAHFGRCYADRALSLTLAGVGSGAGREGHEQFKKDAHDNGRAHPQGRHGEVCRKPDDQPDALALQAEGSARLRRVHASTSPSIRTSAPPTPWRTTRASGRRSTTSRTEWKELDVPTLIICGDEDDPCLQPSLYLKRVLPNAGLAMFAKTGHTVNIEEPDAFNRELWNFIVHGGGRQVDGAAGRSPKALALI